LQGILLLRREIAALLHTRNNHHGFQADPVPINEDSAALDRASPLFQSMDLAEPTFVDVDFAGLRSGVFLGSGRFGSVYRATLLRADGQPVDVAAKFVGDPRPKSQKNFLREVEVSCIVLDPPHPAILRILGFSIFDRCILSELGWADLAFILSRESHTRTDSIPFCPTLKWDSVKASICILGITDGMRHIHSFSLAHRDLKPANILLDRDSYPKIADFGVARQLALDVTANAGTPLYMAPEQFMDPIAHESADVYSFSMIAYEVATGQVISAPRRAQNQFALGKLVVHGLRPTIPPGSISPAMERLITGCWDAHAEARPTFEDIVERIVREKIVVLGCEPNCEEFRRYCHSLDLEMDPAEEEEEAP
jgi:serine/threonine protein kinase